MQPDATPPSTDPVRPAFAAVPERSSGDHLLRVVQQHHVQLSTMADTKANIIITVSSIVLTLVLGRLQDPELRTGLLVLGAFTLVALLVAILAVVPKFRGVKKHEGPLPPWFNVLFFGHFTSLDRERFLRELADAMARARPTKPSRTTSTASVCIWRGTNILTCG